MNSFGVNNLPAPTVKELAELFGPISELIQEIVRDNDPIDSALAVAQARMTEYAMCYEVVPADAAWRRQLPASARRHRSRATAPAPPLPAS